MLLWENVGQSLRTDLEDTTHCKLQICYFCRNNFTFTEEGNENPFSTKSSL